EGEGDIVDDTHRQTLGDILRRTAQRMPHKPAVLCGKVSWTYAELDRVCNRLANGLIGLGVTPGDRVAILARNSHAFVALRFAAARVGAVLVPVTFMLNADEIAFILRSSGAKILAVGPDYVATGRAAAAKETRVGTIVWLPGEDAAQAPPDLPIPLATF